MVNIDAEQLKTKLESLKNLNKDELKANALTLWVQIKPYCINPKTLGGAALIIFALYSGFTGVPEKWKSYQGALSKKKSLVSNKENIVNEEAKLKAISEELSKLEVKPLKIQEGQSPQLAAINVAQKVVDLSEAFHNKYIRLTPTKDPKVISIDSAVTLPIQGAKQTKETTGNINAFVYTLELRGSYINLASFIHELSQLKDFVLIDNITMTPEGVDPENPELGKQINLKMDFSVLWD